MIANNNSADKNQFENKNLIQRRLLTGGCSCTQYCWPTWADYLGKHFQEYINVGLCGADNAVIARNIMSTATQGDIVVVAWSSYDRFNYFNGSFVQSSKTIGDKLVAQWSGLDESGKGGWKHNGGLRSSKNFLVNYYHRVERFRHSLDYVKMLEMHSKINGYELWNFSMIEWFLGESEIYVDSRLQKMHVDMHFNHFFLAPSLMEVREKVAPIVVSHKYNLNDTHPTPLVHWTWLKEHIAPEIKISLDLSLENQVKLDQDRVLAGDVD